MVEFVENGAAQATRTGITVKFERVVPEVCVRTDKQTDKTHIDTLLPSRRRSKTKNVFTYTVHTYIGYIQLNWMA